MTSSRTQKILDSLRTVPENPADAYVARFRLKRLLVECAREISLTFRLPPPEGFSGLELGDADSPDIAAVVALYRGVYAKASRLLLPSEAFDARWQNHWDDLAVSVEGLVSATESLARRQSSGSVSGPAKPAVDLARSDGAL